MAALVNPIKPPVAIPKDPARSSFNVVTPEIWAHRDIPMDEDDGFVHVCFSLSFSLSLSLSFGGKGGSALETLHTKAMPSGSSFTRAVSVSSTFVVMTSRAIDGFRYCCA